MDCSRLADRFVGLPGLVPSLISPMSLLSCVIISLLAKLYWYLFALIIPLSSVPSQVPLLFRLDARDPLRQKKARFWRMDGPQQRRVRLCVGDTDAVRGALSMLRIVVADAAEMVVVEGEYDASEAAICRFRHWVSSLSSWSLSFRCFFSAVKAM